jgi:hypothetical protein
MDSLLVRNPPGAAGPASLTFDPNTAQPQPDIPCKHARRPAWTGASSTPCCPPCQALPPSGRRAQPPGPGGFPEQADQADRALPGRRHRRRGDARRGRPAVGRAAAAHPGGQPHRRRRPHRVDAVAQAPRPTATRWCRPRRCWPVGEHLMADMAGRSRTSSGMCAIAAPPSVFCVWRGLPAQSLKEFMALAAGQAGRAERGQPGQRQLHPPGAGTAVRAHRHARSPTSTTAASRRR